MRSVVVIAATAVFGLVPSLGLSYDAPNRTQVENTGSGSFEVFERDANSSAVSFWCGAGSYVIDELHQPDGTVIYVARALGRSDSKPSAHSVVFTTEPSADLKKDASDTYDITVETVGYTMPAYEAQQQCENDNH